MIKRILLTLLEFIVFIVLLAVGGNWDAVNLALEMHALQQHKTASMLIPVFKYPVGSHILIANGLIFATVLLVLLLLVLLIFKKLHPWAWLAILAYLLAVCLAFAMKLGLPPADVPAQSHLRMPHVTTEDASLLRSGRVVGSFPIVSG
jgi:hypothetical protein